MNKFNTIHKSQTWAFIDGLLVGAQISFLLTYGYLKYREMNPIKALEEELDEHENLNP